MSVALKALEPHQVAGLFGRHGALLQRLPLVQRMRPVNLCLAFMAVGVLTTCTVANVDDALVVTNTRDYALAALVKGVDRPKDLELPLLFDPVGIAVILVTLATPIFAAMQIEAIGRFVRMNEANLTTHALQRLPAQQVNALVIAANKQFNRVGGRGASAIIAAGSAAVTGWLYTQLEATGVLRSWNTTELTSAEWQERVFAGWWANGHEHLPMAIALCVLGWYMFYFLGKQLAVGFIFAAFAKRARRIGFGVTPNVKFDSDGYEGLRPLRRFMQWTYGSSLAHFVITLGVFVVWLPVSPLTFFISVAVMITNASVVIYPSTVAHSGALAVKQDYVKELVMSAPESEERSRMIAGVWAKPSLPFRARSSLTAIGVYLMAPLVLAIFSAVLKGGGK